MAISRKKYICPVCKYESSHETNHFGAIYTNCRICGNTGLNCIEPEAMKARENEYQGKAIFHYYNFNTEYEEQREEWQSLKLNLKLKGYKLFSSIDGNTWKYWEMLKEFDNKEILLSTKYLFDNQWNSELGRLMDFKHTIYPNRRIKKGYWLEFDEDTKNIRSKFVNCRYCGNMKPLASQPEGDCECPYRKSNPSDIGIMEYKIIKT